MESIKKPTLYPVYLKDFSCIGKDCKETCCKGWTIPVDKPTYNKYMQVPKDNPIAGDLKKHIQKNRSALNIFAKIKLDEEKNCPFLNEQGLCNIQLNLGEDYLTHTCDIFPRIFYIVDGVVYQDISISCEAATKLVLPLEGGIDYTFDEANVSKRKLVNIVEINTSSKEYAFSFVKYIKDIQSCSIDILQNRQYTITKRMILLGIFMRMINTACEEQKINEIPSLIQQFSQLFEQNAFDSAFQDVTADYNFQLQFSFTMWYKNYMYLKSKNRSTDVLLRFFDGIGADLENLKYSVMTKNYQQGYNTYCREFLDQHEFYLENFLVSLVFSSIFPTNLKTPIESYAYVCSLLAVFKGLLVGLATNNRALNEDILLEAAAFTIRNLHKDIFFKESVIKNVNDSNLDVFGYAALLLVN